MSTQWLAIAYSASNRVVFPGKLQEPGSRSFQQHHKPFGTSPDAVKPGRWLLEVSLRKTDQDLIG